MEKIKSKKSKPIQICLFIGLDKSLEFKERYTDDLGNVKNNNVKDLILNIINKRLALNVVPILFVGQKIAYFHPPSNGIYRISQNRTDKNTHPSTP